MNNRTPNLNPVCTVFVWSPFRPSLATSFHQIAAIETNITPPINDDTPPNTTPCIINTNPVNTPIAPKLAVIGCCDTSNIWKGCAVTDDISILYKRYFKLRLWRLFINLFILSFPLKGPYKGGRPLYYIEPSSPYWVLRTHSTPLPLRGRPKDGGPLLRRGL